MSRLYSNCAFLFGMAWSFVTGVALGLVVGVVCL